MLLILLAACAASVKPIQFESCETMCADHQGVDEIAISYDIQGPLLQCVCQDMTRSLWLFDGPAFEIDN